MVSKPVRKTEIDRADDLIIPLDEEPEEEAAETPGAAEAAKEEVPSPIEASSPAEEKSARRAGPRAIALYWALAIGAVLLISLGWTFAFIARSGLTPPAPASLGRVVSEGKAGLLDSRRISRSTSRRPEVGAASALAVPLPHPFYIPLEGGKKRRGEDTVFLRLALTLEVSNQAAVSEVELKRPLIRKAIYEHFNRLSPRMLDTVEGRDKARQALVARLSKDIVQGKVRQIYFQEFFTR